MSWITEKGNGLVLTLRVVPRSSKNKIDGLLGEALKVRIQAPPVEGKANAYLLKFLAKQWKVPRRSLVLLAGETGRNKRLEIVNPPDELRKELLSIGMR
jgi:uncharacterized protein (TIGR00251 family)